MTGSDTTEQKLDELYNIDEVLSRVDAVLSVESEEERSVKARELVDSRLKLLTENSSPAEISNLSKPYIGFIHPESRIYRTFLVDPFHIDDPDLYIDLIKTFREIHNHPGYKDRSLREIVPHVVQRTLGIYFGNHWSTDSTENRNRAFYMDRVSADSEDISLKELKGQNLAVCAEKAAVAQNLLSFLGYKSELIVSSKCKLDPKVETDTNHLFLIVNGKNGYSIYDPTNPVLIEDSEGFTISTLPMFYPIKPEERQRLISGDTVNVIHRDLTLKDDIYAQEEEVYRIYGGPSKNLY